MKAQVKTVFKCFFFFFFWSSKKNNKFIPTPSPQKNGGGRREKKTMWIVNQLIGFYMMETLIVYHLKTTPNSMKKNFEFFVALTIHL